MTNPVLGYQTQTDAKVGEVNINKTLEEEVLQRLDALELLGNIDQRWLAIGRSHIEQGFMAINRSIFQPSRITLERR